MQYPVLTQNHSCNPQILFFLFIVIFGIIYSNTLFLSVLSTEYSEYSEMLVVYNLTIFLNTID